MYQLYREQFETVAVVACDDEILSVPEHIETIAAESELDEVFGTKGDLFCVAFNRKRNGLMVAGKTLTLEFFANVSGRARRP